MHVKSSAGSPAWHIRGTVMMQVDFRVHNFQPSVDIDNLNLKFCTAYGCSYNKVVLLGLMVPAASWDFSANMTAPSSSCPVTIAMQPCSSLATILLYTT